MPDCASETSRSTQAQSTSGCPTRVALSPAERHRKSSLGRASAEIQDLFGWTANLIGLTLPQRAGIEAA